MYAAGVRRETFWIGVQRDGAVDDISSYVHIGGIYVFSHGITVVQVEMILALQEENARSMVYSWLSDWFQKGEEVG